MGHLDRHGPGVHELRAEVAVTADEPRGDPDAAGGYLGGVLQVEALPHLPGTGAEEHKEELRCAGGVVGDEAPILAAAA